MNRAYDDYATNSADIVSLKQFMYDETHNVKYYTDFAARRSAACAAGALREIASAANLHRKKLQAEYFILTGETYGACVADVTIPLGLTDALRECFLAQSALVQAYIKAAAATSNPRLALLYTEFAADKTTHASTLNNLVAKALC